MKTRTQSKRLLSMLLILCMALTLLPTMAFAADTVYQVTGTEETDFIEGVINGTEKDATGNAYTGISFPTGTYTYALSKPLSIQRDFTMETDEDANVVFSDQYFSFPTTAERITVTFKGEGSITVQNGPYGIWALNNMLTLNFESCSFLIQNTTGFGFYKVLGGSGTKVNISGAHFEMMGCATASKEGGVEFDGGQLSITNGATVQLEGNGNSSFGDLYYNGTEPLTVSGEGTTLTINATRPNNLYGMVLAGGGTMVIDDHAVVSINQSANLRGINAGSSATNTIAVKNSGELHVIGNASGVNGIRRCTVSVEDNGILEVSGFAYALDGSQLNAGADSFVTLNGTMKDIASIPFFTGGVNGVTITGGSVLAEPTASVINGILTSTGNDRIAPTPINDSSEALTRFDLADYTSPIQISTTNASYDYEIGKDHNGTAYIWAPAVKVSFWTDSSKTTGVNVTGTADANGEQNSFAVISGGGLALVGTTAPTAPAGVAGTIPSWTIDGTTPVNLKTAVFTEDTDLYPIYPAGYTVTYDSNGGSGTQTDNDSPYLSGSTVTVLGQGNVLRNSYTFLGWDTDKTATTPTYTTAAIAAGTAQFAIEANTTLYAVWKYNGGGSSGSTTYTATLTKVDSEDSSTFLSDAKFELYKVNTNGKDTLIGTYTTDASGKITAGSLNAGNYYWVEISAPSGYKLDESKHEFSLTSGSKAVTVSNVRSDVPKWLNGDDHYAYVIGYSDGNVHPEANITRAEVATIFFRLLTDDVRNQYMTTSNSFSDVNPGLWCNTAISTMAKMGIVNGYTDGTFNPTGKITRAEFAAIAARFDSNGNTGSASFSDIYGHWAQKEIGIAANNGWILGYTDGTFRPDQLITRAEAMTMVNRVLQRVPEFPSDLLNNMVQWPDNMDTSKWYYLAVQEATNSHEYKRKTNGYETWTELRAVRDWAEFEH